MSREQRDGSPKTGPGNAHGDRAPFKVPPEPFEAQAVVQPSYWPGPAPMKNPPYTGEQRSVSVETAKAPPCEVVPHPGVLAIPPPPPPAAVRTTTEIVPRAPVPIQSNSPVWPSLVR